MRPLPIPLVVVTALACARPMPGAPAEPPAPAPAAPLPPALASLAPASGIFSGTLLVLVTTDRPAQVVMTRDGSDPRSSETRFTLVPPASILLDETTTLTWFTRPESGLEGEVHSAFYVRAGDEPGTASGTVVVGAFAAGHEIVLLSDGAAVSLGFVDAPRELPFRLEGLSGGTHRLLAYADLNDDGAFSPLGDVVSELVEYRLDLSDPFQASFEGARLLLAASRPGLGTLRGTVSFPTPVSGHSLTVAALDAAMAQGGADPQLLLQQLAEGYQVFTNATDTSYPFVITDLEPGSYLPVPVLGGLSGGLSMNLLLDPRAQRQIAPGGEAFASFAFGEVALSGTATLLPAAPPTGLVWGMVAARNLSLSTFSMQVVLAPTLFFASGADLALRGGFAGQALRANEWFDARAFTTLDSAQPIPAALAWGLNPRAPEPPQARFLATPPSVSVEFEAR